MPALVARCIDRDPIGMRFVHLLMRRVRIGAGNYGHVQFAASRHQIAERIGVMQPLAAVMQRNLRRVIGYRSSCAQAGRVGVSALKVVEPEGKIILAGIVFD
jgi:hypothetical protein